MTERTYLVAVDAWNTKHDVSSVKDFIQNSPLIIDWWNYIPYVFLVVSPLSTDALTEALKVHTKDASLLVIEANPRNSQGLLQKRAWKWIDRRAQEQGNGDLTQAAMESAERPSALSQAATTNAEKP